MIADYELLVSHTRDGLNEMVYNHLKDGWKLYGNPGITMVVPIRRSVGEVDPIIKYFQAVIVEIQDPE